MSARSSDKFNRVESCPKGNLGYPLPIASLEKKPQSDTALLALAMFQSNNRSRKHSAGRHIVPVWKRDDQSHVHEVVRHAGNEIETVPREIDYLAHIFDLREANVERPHMHGQRDLQPFPARCVAWRSFSAALDCPAPWPCRRAHVELLRCSIARQANVRNASMVSSGFAPTYGTRVPACFNQSPSWALSPGVS